MCRRRLWKWVSLSLGALLGNLGGGPFTRNFERQLKEGSRNVASFSMSTLLGETGGVSFTGDPEGYVKEGSGNGHLSSYRPRWGTWSGLIYQGL